MILDACVRDDGLLCPCPDLPDPRIFSYGEGEVFTEDVAAVIVDWNGDGPVIAQPGLVDTTDQYVDADGNPWPNAPFRMAGHPVFTPGERFIDIDIDADGRWDALDEATNLSDSDADGLVDRPGPWVDLNADGLAENAESMQGCGNPEQLACVFPTDVLPRYRACEGGATLGATCTDDDDCPDGDCVFSSPWFVNSLD